MSMKVLILSHNPITTYHNMGKTMMKMFSSFKKEEICQFYCFPTIPDVDACSSYYRMTDKDVLRSYLKFFKVSGREIKKSEISPENGLYENPSDSRIYRPTGDLKRLFRDVMWRHTGWYSDALRAWVEKERPTHLMIAPGDAEFLYEICFRLSADYGLPVITYICDEFYFLDEIKGFFRKIRYQRLKKKFEKLMSVTSLNIAICEEIKTRYENTFHVKTEVVMSAADVIRDKPAKPRAPHTLTYMGNLRYNRNITLFEIGAAMDRIREEESLDVSLDIYTPEKNREILSPLEKIRSIRLFPFVQGEAYSRVFYSREMFLHVEAFDSVNTEIVKHSISTKIPDILGSAIPLMTVAPAHIASTDYLLKNGCSLCVTDKKDLYDTLKKVFESKIDLSVFSEKGLAAAKKNHDAKTNSTVLYNLIKNIN